MKYSEGSCSDNTSAPFVLRYPPSVSEDEPAFNAQAGRGRKTGGARLVDGMGKNSFAISNFISPAPVSATAGDAELVHEPKRVLDRLLAEGHKHEVVALDQQIDVFNRIIPPAA